jgi:hypothetical protein
MDLMEIFLRVVLGVMLAGLVIVGAMAGTEIAERAGISAEGAIIGGLATLGLIWANVGLEIK